MTKIMPSSTRTEASGKPSRRCSSPPLAPMPPRRIETGMTAKGFCRARNAADHIDGADLARRRLVEAGRVAHRALDQIVEDRQRDIHEQQARNRFVDANRRGRNWEWSRPR